VNNFGNNMNNKEASELIEEFKKHISKSIFGQEKLINETLCAFLSGGHILMTGAPGLAKTTLVRVFARFLGLEFGRIQYTPDLLPSDITGTELLNIDNETGKRSFDFKKGPIFTNLLLADEINRATPRTQSAMLESMQERKVTTAGKQFPLPEPFMVFATQNPFESEGTFPLPEAQLDRFLIHSLVEYPDLDSELKILSAHDKSELVGEQSDISNKDDFRLTSDQIKGLFSASQNVEMSKEILDAIASFVRLTRPEQDLPEEFKGAVWYGAGPRAGLSLVSICKSYAVICGDDSVRWSHVKEMLKPVFRHRVKLVPAAERDFGGVDNFLEKLLVSLETKYSNLVKGN
jgi:MoxR-like ATPase